MTTGVPPEAGIDYQSLATPWAPEPVIWIDSYTDYRLRLTQAAQQAGPLATHFVREVFVSINNGPKTNDDYSLDDHISATDAATTEFTALRDVGISVPNVAWHSFVDPCGKPRTLARVAIIRGETIQSDDEDEQWFRLFSFDKEPLMKWKSTSADLRHRQLQSQLRLQLIEYLRQKRLNDWVLGDIDRPDQYLNGIPNGTVPTQQPDVTLIDIEPQVFQFNSIEVARFKTKRFTNIITRIQNSRITRYE